MKIETVAQANKAIVEARTVYIYAKSSGFHLKISKTQAYSVVKQLPEFEDAWETQAVRPSSENDLIIEI